ncbi:methylcytosine dioxygenase TET1 [Otolemur garnettii]|uniref:methylcytosine dioxygenase TET1 n=1 Tax=Otolemur garnettii TaxID=30611 RepID=UPI000643FBCC|nr:methylcytosine dioxygenase TET1 [Otolemur garnettii]
MSRSRHARPSRLDRKEDVNKKKNSQLKKISKPANKNVASVKTLSPGKLKQFIQERDVKKKTESKPPIPGRSLLTRAGAARMNLNRTEVLFQNPESLTCNGFTMALRSTSLNRRLSQPPVVPAKSKKVPPSKDLEKQHNCDYKVLADLGVKHSENDSVPMQDTLISPTIDNLICVQNASLIKGESQEATQCWSQSVEDSKISIPLHSGPVTEILSGPLKGTCCEGLFSEETWNDTSGPPRVFPQDTVCASLPQRAAPKVTSQRNTSIQLEDLGSRVESLKLSDSYLDPIKSEYDCCPTSSFNKVIPELNPRNCLSIGGSTYPTSVMKFFLTGSQQEILGAKPDHQEAFKPTADQQEVPDNTSVLGQAFGAIPHQWEFPGANLVRGEALGENPDPPEIPGAIPVQGEIFGTILDQHETIGAGRGAVPDLPIFLPVPPITVATYNAPPKWLECQSTVSYGLELQGAMHILPLGSGHTPQSSSNSEISLVPPVMTISNVENEKQVQISFLPANTQGFTLAPERGFYHNSLGIAQLSQASPSQSERDTSGVSMTSMVDVVNTTVVSMPVSLSSTSSSSYTTLLPTLEKKKRKRCGVCEPCQQKTNCGECTYCKNRKNSHQICKKRKCEELKKKPSVIVPFEVIKENKRPQREKKPKVLKADVDNKTVNGPTSESMDCSKCGHGEEQRSELNPKPPENVTENEETMTGVEVEKWTQSKKSHLTAHIKGDFSANVTTEAEKSKTSAIDKKPNKPSKLFAQKLRNGIKNVHYLPPETKMSFKKFNIEEFGKAFENNSYKFLKDPANHNNAMSSFATGGSCDDLKERSDALVFQKPGFNCNSNPESSNVNNTNSQNSTHNEGDRPTSLENMPSDEPKDGIPVQAGILSLMKDRRLTVEQVVAIEALTKLSEAPAGNSSSSKSEKRESTEPRPSTLFNSHQPISSIEDLQDPNTQGESPDLHHSSSLEKQSSYKIVIFNGQNAVSNSHTSSTSPNQAPTKSYAYSKVTNSVSLIMPKTSSSKIDPNKNISKSQITYDSCSEILHQLPPVNKLGDCNQLLDNNENLDSGDLFGKDAAHTQIEEDVATQLAQLASIIKSTDKNPEGKEVESKDVQQEYIEEKSIVPQKTPASVQDDSSSSTKQKNTSQKKTKSTPSRERRKKIPIVVSSEEKHKQNEKKWSNKYRLLYDIWIGSRLQRYGQFCTLAFPILFGEIPPITTTSRPLVPTNSTTQEKKLFPPVTQIQYERRPESAQQKMVKVEPSDSLTLFDLQTESNRQASADQACNSQVQSAVNVSQEAHPSAQLSSPSNQCATVMGGNDQIQLQPEVKEQPMHQSQPTLPGICIETPLLDQAQIRRNINVVCSGGITVVSAKREACSSGIGISEISSVDSVQKQFNDYAMNFFSSYTNHLVSVTKGSELPTCNCIDRVIQKDKGPNYTHLGAGPSVAAVREIMENRYGQKGNAIRIEIVVYTGKEGKSSHGCPLAKWVIRRSSKEEKVLCLVRKRIGHRCPAAVMVVLIMVWEGIPLPMADRLYTELTESLKSYNGHPTDRRCTLNENRTCTCQGIDPETCGASFSFGCSWSMYFNGCKFGRSPSPRRFRIDPSSPVHEKNLEDNLQGLATVLGPLYQQYAPVAYQNQVHFETLHSSLVCTLTREDNRTLGVIPQDEQLHVLPLYKLADTDEFGSREGMEAKIRSGAIEVLKPQRRKRTRFTQPVPRSGKKRAAMMTEVLAHKIRAVEKKVIPKVKRTATSHSKPSSLPLVGNKTETVQPEIKSETEPHFIFKVSDNTKTYSHMPSAPHPPKEANISPGFSCSLKSATTTTATLKNDAKASQVFSERNIISHCTMPCESLSGAQAAAGECTGIAQPCEMSPLPTLSTPRTDSLVFSEPPTGPPEQSTAHQPNQQSSLLPSPDLASTLMGDDEQHSEADEPMSDEPLSEEPLSQPEEGLPHIDEYWSDNEHIFLDPNIGGVAIAPAHGSVLIECARRELHATTAVEHPNRNHPTRLSLVFYQHKNLNKPQHGFELNRMKFEAKEAKKKKMKTSEQKDQAANEGPELSSGVNELNQIPSRRALTLTRDSVVTVSTYALTHVAGPYNHWV